MKKMHSGQKSLIVAILILFLISASSAYAEWTVATFPNPDFRKIDFIDSNEGWALGVGSTLLHFSNGEWTTSQLPDVGLVNRQLSDIQFISRDEGWAAGYIEEYSEGNPRRGVLYHYTNGDWTPVSLPDISTNWSLSSIQFFSPNEGWVAGVDSTNPINERVILLQYTNGEWKINTFAQPGASIRRGQLLPTRIAFTSPNEGWIIGTPGLILHYVNGQWEKSRIPLNCQLNSIQFVSPNEGWAVGNRNYGRSSKGLLLHYLNGRWRSIRPRKVSSNWGLFGVDFISPDEGWAVGNSYSEGMKGILLHYLNGSWTSVDIPNLEDFLLGSYFSDVQFLSSSEGWIAGYVIAEHLAIGYRLNALLLKYSSP